jgi:hypothetical protein
MSNVIIIGKSLDRLLEKLAITTEDEIGFLHHDPESNGSNDLPFLQTFYTTIS